MTLNADAPSTATRKIASRMSGNAIIASIRRMIGRVEAAEIAGEQAEQRAEPHREGDHRRADAERGARAVDRAGEDVAAEFVGAEPVLAPMAASGGGGP